MYLTSPLLPQRHRILIDTGAQFSAISLDLVRRHNLQVDRVPAGEPQSLALAARNKSVRRMGTTTLPITVHFAGDLRRQPYECTKSFEVIDMLYDFILGVDIIPAGGCYLQLSHLSFCHLLSAVCSYYCCYLLTGVWSASGGGRHGREHCHQQLYP